MSRFRFVLRALAGCGLALAVSSCKPSDRDPNASRAAETGGGAHPDGAEPASSPREWFRDVTLERGLDFVHEAGLTGEYFMPECIGSGVALFDFDSDGRLDLYLIQNGGDVVEAPNRLYRQGEDGRFVDRSAGSGLDVSGRGMGVAVGDVDNDGRPDLVLTEYGQLRLFHNQGDGVFRELGETCGVASKQWGTSASFLDFDRDGWLDLVVAQYLSYDPARPCSRASNQREYCGPDAFPGVATLLFRNLGDADGAPHFEDRTQAAGLAAAPGPGLGVVALDFDGDRWVDILVANDGKANHLWMNQRDGTFREEGIARGIALNAMGRTEANMGIAIGDVDGDTAFDVFVTHLTVETPTLWKQAAPGIFEDATSRSRLHDPAWRGTGFGTVMGDFDLDGDLDIAAVNGRVERDLASRDRGPFDPELSERWKPYAERDQLFANDSRGRFVDVSEANSAFSGHANVSRGVAAGDLDNDGDLDLVVTTIGGRARVFENRAAPRGHWLLVRAIDPALRRDAYGAELVLVAGERRHWRWINPGSSYLSSNDPRAHIGLGEAASYDRIEVTWPRGDREEFPGGPADREVRLERGTGRSLEDAR